MIKKFFSIKIKRYLSIFFLWLRKMLISVDSISINPIKKPVRKAIKITDYFLTKLFGSNFIEFEVSSACNARCIFCLYPEIVKSGKRLKNMDAETFEKALENIKQTHYSLLSFTPTTGDIFMNKDWFIYVDKIRALKNIKQIFFYSNAILLNEENQDKLIEILKKDKTHKIFALLFSVGGTDRETYNTMFGVDKFDVVKENINNFLKKLQAEDIIVKVGLEFRLPKDTKLDFNKAKLLFNQTDYEFCSIDVLYKYMYNNHIAKLNNLDYMVEVKNPKRACSYLHKTRYAADGGVWADGCMISEMPNDYSLKLGEVSDSIELIEKNRKKIITDWEQENKIPKPCQGCSFYR